MTWLKFLYNARKESGFVFGHPLQLSLSANLGETCAWLRRVSGCGCDRMLLLFHNYYTLPSRIPFLHYNVINWANDHVIPKQHEILPQAL
jgi:hypothetical protein